METRLVKIFTPGLSLLAEIGVPDGTPEDQVISVFKTTYGGDGNTVRLDQPWVLLERQAITCPACNENFKQQEMTSNRCPRCGQEVIDPQTMQPLVVGGRQLTIGNVLFAASWSHIHEVSGPVTIGLNNAVIALIQKDSQAAKLIEMGKAELEAIKQAELLSKSGLVVAGDIKAVDKMAKMHKKAHEHLKEGGFKPKLV